MVFNCGENKVWFLASSFWTVQLVYRTVGFSGADIRNLVNEAAIMSVSKTITYLK